MQHMHGRVPAGREGWDGWTWAIVTLGLLAAAALLWQRFGGRGASAGGEPRAPVAVAVPTADPASGVSRVVGRWVRQDGGYVLAIRAVQGDGRLDASYLNPRPIFISRAEAKDEVEGVVVRVELQDEGYPGCTYTLRYHPTNDVLTGVYYQAAIQESFDVVFTRAPQGPP